MKTPSVGAVSFVAGQTQKLFYQINEVARMTGVKPYVLRYWETEFAELSPEKSGSNQRRYRSKDILTVMAIRKLLYEDRYTIKGARKRLREEIQQFGRKLSMRPPQTAEIEDGELAEELAAEARAAAVRAAAIQEIDEEEDDAMPEPLSAQVSESRAADPAAESSANAAPRRRSAGEIAALRMELTALRKEVTDLMDMIAG